LIKIHFQPRYGTSQIFEKAYPPRRTTRTAIKALRELTEKTEAEKFLPKVVSMIDKLAKKNTWHANKAANLKSSLMHHIATM
jgi:small subunit ribosomal protein S20